MDKLNAMMKAPSCSFLEPVLMPCVLVLTFYSVMHVPFDGLTTSVNIVHGTQWLVQLSLKGMAWAKRMLAQGAAPRSIMTQPFPGPGPASTPTTQQSQQQQDSCAALEVSASQEPLDSSAGHRAQKPHAAPHSSSESNNPSLRANADIDNTGKMAEPQPAPAAPPKEAEASKTEKPEEQAKLSNAELKKKAKADKAARRAKVMQDREQGDGAGNEQQQQQQPGGAKKGGGGAKQDKQQGAQKQQAAQPTGSESAKKKEQRVNENTPAMFAHLAWQTHRGGVTTAGKDVHPAVLSLGIQIRDYVICGSSARCVATLLAFKQVCCYLIPSSLTSLEGLD